MSVSRQPIQHNIGNIHRVLRENPRVFVDFHNADAQGRLRLNCIGTLEDLSVQKVELQSGQQLTLYSEDLEVDGLVEYSHSEHIWVVIIDWNEIRQIEEVNLAQKRLFDSVEKLGAILKLLEIDTQVSSDSNLGSTQHEIQELLDESQQDLKNARATLSKEQDIDEAKFYQQFADIFGEEEAKEIWSVRSWNKNIVLRDLALILRDEPELRQNVEQKGFNLEEIINMLSQEVEFKKFSTELTQTGKRSVARLREVIFGR